MQTMHDYFNWEVSCHLRCFHSFEQSLIYNRKPLTLLSTIFQEMLGKTRIFISNAKPYLFTTAQNNVRKSVGHMVVLRELENKVNAIMGVICPETQTGLLPNLPLFFLRECQESVLAYLKSNIRLPFSSTETLIQYYRTTENELEGNLEGLYQARVQLAYAYHLLADRLNEDELLEKNEFEECFGGSTELKGAMSYARIMQELSLFVPLERKEVFKFLSDRIMWLEAFALKTTFLLKVKKQDSWDAQQNYLLDLFDMLEQRKIADDFYRLYRLSKHELSIAEWALLNEISHDVLDMIKGLAIGSRGIFCAGTKDHIVIVQVERSEEDAFLYTLFNTGDGSDLFTCFNGELEQFVRPLIFRGLNRRNLSYDFIEKLFKFSLDKEATIEAFYTFHLEKLTKEANGYVDYESAKLVRSTSLGICSYHTLDAWIDSYLTPSEMIEKEKIKVQRALEKQNQVIDYLQKEVAKNLNTDELPEIDYLLTKALQLKSLYEGYQAKLTNGSQLKEFEQKHLMIYQAFEQSA